jgi:hypothetical protein
MNSARKTDEGDPGSLEKAFRNLAIRVYPIQ